MQALCLCTRQDRGAEGERQDQTEQQVAQLLDMLALCRGLPPVASMAAEQNLQVSCKLIGSLFGGGGGAHTWWH